MRVMTGRHVRSALVGLFITATIGFLLVLTILIVVQRNFPLNLGLVRTTGRAGLFVSLLPALVGTVGLALLRYKRAAGAMLVAAYSAFWAIVFLGGLPQVWNARQSFCLNALNFCIVSPWIARLTVLAIATPFLLSAWWALRQAFDPHSRGASRNEGESHLSPD
jgi:hypothetical protein